MLKKRSLALAVTSALAAGVAMGEGIELASYHEGVVVPRAIFTSSLQTTVVGLQTSQCDEAFDNNQGFPGVFDEGGGKVFWTFFDVDSNHITDGSFDMTDHDFFGFNWSEQAGVGLEGREGYLVFYIDTNGDGRGNNITSTDDADCLAANAFQVDVAANDVEYVPVIPFEEEDLNPRGGQGEVLSNLDEGSLLDLDDGFDSSSRTLSLDRNRVDMRYFIDNQPGGTDSEIVVFTTYDITKNSAGDSGERTRFTVNMFDDDQNRKSVNFDLNNKELNIIDPETIVGRPLNFLDGFISFEIPVDWDDDDGDSDISAMDEGPSDDVPGEAVIYTVVRSTSFNAAQTLWGQEWD